MRKISITGPASKLDTVIRKLHDLELLDIDDYNGQHDEFELGTPESHADDLSDALVKLRSVKSKLPAIDEEELQFSQEEIDGTDKLREKLISLEEQIDQYKEDISDLQDEQEQKKDLLKRLTKLADLDADLQDIRDYDSLQLRFGTVRNTDFTDELPDGRYELLRDGYTILLFTDTAIDIDTYLNQAGFNEYKLNDIKKLDGKLDRGIRDTKERLDNINAEIETDKQDLAKLAKQALPYLIVNEQEIEEELEKANAPLKFATSDNAFIAKGWIPADAYDDLEQALDDETGGSIHLQEEDTDEEAPPVQHDNPSPIDNFEPLTDLVSVPHLLH